MPHEPRSETAEHAEDLEALERFIVENEDLLDLESQIGRFNIFDALRVGDMEIRHSNFLAFILDPAESHGQGQLFLKALLMDLFKAFPDKRPFSPVELDGADLGEVVVEREWKNIDLVIACKEPAFVVAFENKVRANEGDNQLTKYKDRLQRAFSCNRMHVFLTPDATEPSDLEWVAYTYADVYKVLKRVLKINRNSIGGDVLVLLEHYVSLIGTWYMNDPQNEEFAKIDELCKRIYRNHQRAIDLIIERGKPASGVIAEAARVLKADDRWKVINQTPRGLFFLPKNWLEWLPPLGLDKNDERAWLLFRIYLQDNMLDFCFYVWPLKRDINRKDLIDRLITELAAPSVGFKKSGGGKGESERTRVIRAEEIIKRSEENEPEPEAVQTAMRSLLDKVHSRLDPASTAVKKVLQSTGYSANSQTGILNEK